MSHTWEKILPLIFAGVFTLNAENITVSTTPEDTVTEKTTPVKATPSANASVSDELKTKVAAALTEQKEWMIFQKGKGVSRLKLFGQQNYYGPKETDIFKVAKVDDKYYAQLKSGTIFEEHWENKDKFNTNFIPYAKFIEAQDKQIETLKQNIDKQNKDFSKNNGEIEQQKKTVRDINSEISVLKNRIQQKIRDKKSTDSEERQIDSLDNQLKTVKRKIHDNEKENKEIKKELKKLGEEMEKMKIQRKKYPSL